MRYTTVKHLMKKITADDWLKLNNASIMLQQKPVKRRNFDALLS
jgi:hypothetical protein